MQTVVSIIDKFEGEVSRTMPHIPIQKGDFISLRTLGIDNKFLVSSVEFEFDNENCYQIINILGKLHG